MSGGEVVEQVIRPTGLVDPVVRVEPARGQVPAPARRGQATGGPGRARPRHDAHQAARRGPVAVPEGARAALQVAALRARRLRARRRSCESCARGRSTPWSASNLLREGLDLPEVSMVCILDADKEGFLRSETSLIQTIGRSARHVNAEVVLYADKVTESMQRAIDETNRRRALQLAYNAEHGITPEGIVKAIRRGIEEEIQAKAEVRKAVGRDETTEATEEFLNELEAEMLKAAENLEFERAAAFRDRIVPASFRREWRQSAAARQPPGGRRPSQGRWHEEGGPAPETMTRPGHPPPRQMTQSFPSRTKATRGFVSSWRGARTCQNGYALGVR